jgi:hypothetical protein
MVYNIYLNSPQLAYQANKKKYYLQVIQKNKIITNQPFKQYTPIYFNTGYNRIYNPNIIIISN